MGKRPRIAPNGVRMPLSCSQRATLMGAHRLWGHRAAEGAFNWDAWWSVSPLHVWKFLISGTLTLGGTVQGELTQSIRFPLWPDDAQSFCKRS